MPILNLPSLLKKPIVLPNQPDRIICKVVQDLTVYLVGPSEKELEFLIDLYERLCPLNRLVKYKIAEFGVWPRIDSPVWTLSSREAAASGVNRPYFEPTRKRIRDGRAFEAQLWDGREISDLEGSWSFNCQRIHLRSTGLHAFARILVPLDTDPHILCTAAQEIADNVKLYSGHGGLAFVYDPWFIASAFDATHALARRFWGVDVENLNDTLTSMKDNIKGVNWITILGPRLSSDDSVKVIDTALSQLASLSEISIKPQQYGTVLIAGSQPVAGDQHRPGHSLDPYYAVANTLAPLFIKTHPDFPSEKFINNDNTVGWIRRFIDPDAWQ